MTKPVDIDQMMQLVQDSIRADERSRAIARMAKLIQFTEAHLQRFPNLAEVACAVLDEDAQNQSVPAVAWRGSYFAVNEDKQRNQA